MRFRNIDIEELIKLMKENGVSEINLKEGRASIEIKMGGNNKIIQAVESIAEPVVTATIPKKEENAPKETVEAKEESKKEENNYYEVKSPMVGTFYRAPAPDADPFVEVGDKVKVGQTLCIVEAMKNMNEIETEVDGIVKEICVENAKPVEYGQVLFKIEPIE